jgi:hypothetical protein
VSSIPQNSPRFAGIHPLFRRPFSDRSIIPSDSLSFPALRLVIKFTTLRSVAVQIGTRCQFVGPDRHCLCPTPRPALSFSSLYFPSFSLPPLHLSPSSLPHRQHDHHRTRRLLLRKVSSCRPSTFSVSFSSTYSPPFRSAGRPLRLWPRWTIARSRKSSLLRMTFSFRRLHPFPLPTPSFVSSSLPEPAPLMP